MRRTRIGIGILAGASFACSIGLVIHWSDLRRAYDDAYRLRTDPDFFLQTIESPGTQEMRDTLVSFLGTAEGRLCLFNAFASEILVVSGSRQ